MASVIPFLTLSCGWDPLWERGFCPHLLASMKMLVPGTQAPSLSSGLARLCPCPSPPWVWNHKTVWSSLNPGDSHNYRLQWHFPSFSTMATCLPVFHTLSFPLGMTLSKLSATTPGTWPEGPYIYSLLQLNLASIPLRWSIQMVTQWHPRSQYYLRRLQMPQVIRKMERFPIPCFSFLLRYKPCLFVCPPPHTQCKCPVFYLFTIDGSPKFVAKSEPGARWGESKGLGQLQYAQILHWLIHLSAPSCRILCV